MKYSFPSFLARSLSRGNQKWTDITWTISSIFVHIKRKISDKLLSLACMNPSCFTSGTSLLTTRPRWLEPGISRCQWCVLTTRRRGLGCCIHAVKQTRVTSDGDWRKRDSGIIRRLTHETRQPLIKLERTNHSTTVPLLCCHDNSHWWGQSSNH